MINGDLPMVITSCVFIANIFRKELAAEELACEATADIFHLLVKLKAKNNSLNAWLFFLKKSVHINFLKNVLYYLNVYAGIYILENPAISLDIAGDNALLAREKAKSIKDKFYFVYNEAIRAQIVLQSRTRKYYARITY